MAGMKINNTRERQVMFDPILGKLRAMDDVDLASEMNIVTDANTRIEYAPIGHTHDYSKIENTPNISEEQVKVLLGLHTYLKMQDDSYLCFVSENGILANTSLSTDGQEFKQCAPNAKECYIGNDVDTIADNAFWLDAATQTLAYIYIPKTVTKIEGVFLTMTFTNLPEIIIPSSVTYISNQAFGMLLPLPISDKTIIIERLRRSLCVNESDSTKKLYFGDSNTIYFQSVDEDVFDNNFNISSLFNIADTSNTNNKSSYTYEVHTDNRTIYEQLKTAGNERTIFLLCHLDGTLWADGAEN